MKWVSIWLRHYLCPICLLLGFGVITAVGMGCASIEKSDFLSGHEALKKGRYVQSFWGVDDLHKAAFSRIYLEPVDTSRIQAVPGISTNDAAGWLKVATIANLEYHGGGAFEKQPDAATARLALAITYLNPGSVSGRMWASELGVGHAYVQVEGKLTDAATGREIACFADRRRDSGAIGFEDLGGDAGPGMIKRMLDAISLNFIKELVDAGK